MSVDNSQGWQDPDGAAGFESTGAAHALRTLGAVSPPETFSRFRKRAAVMQGTRLLFESQVFGFWVVLNALLRIMLGSRPVTPATGSVMVSRRGGK